MNMEKAYKVHVKTTSCLNDTTNGRDKGKIGDGKIPYRKCINGVIYVVTGDPKKIFDEFPDAVMVECIGLGYSI